MITLATCLLLLAPLQDPSDAGPNDAPDDSVESSFRRGAAASGASAVAYRTLLLAQPAALERGLESWSLESPTERAFAALLRRELSHPERCATLRTLLASFEVTTTVESEQVISTLADEPPLRWEREDVWVAWDAMRTQRASSEASPLSFALLQTFPSAPLVDLLLSHSSHASASLLAGYPASERSRVTQHVRAWTAAWPIEGTDRWRFAKASLNSIVNLAYRTDDPEVFRALLSLAARCPDQSVSMTCYRALKAAPTEEALQQFASALLDSARLARDREARKRYEALRTMATLWPASLVDVLEGDGLDPLASAIAGGLRWELDEPPPSAPGPGPRRPMPIELRRERLEVLGSPDDLLACLPTLALADVERLAFLIPTDQWSPDVFAAVLAWLEAPAPPLATSLAERFITSEDPSTRPLDALAALWRLDPDRALVAAGTLRQGYATKSESMQQWLRHHIAFTDALLDDTLDLSSLLTSGCAPLRRHAASVLGARGDVNAASILLQEALEMRGSEHGRLRTTLLQMPVLREALDAFVLENDSATRLVLGLRDELVHPERWGRIQAVMGPAQGSSQIGPSARQLQRLGHRLAKAAGPDARVWLESTLEFGAVTHGLGTPTRQPPADALVFAIASYQNEASIPFLLQHYSPGRAHRDGSVLAMALAEFGDAGLAAAASLPAAQPELPAFGRRAGRQRAGVEALIEAGDPRGPKQLVDALSSLCDSPEKPHEKARRLEQLSRIGFAVVAPSLAPPLVRLIEQSWIADSRELRNLVMQWLVRIEPADDEPLRQGARLHAGRAAPYEVDPAVTLWTRLDPQPFATFSQHLDHAIDTGDLEQARRWAKALGNLGLYGSHHLGEQGDEATQERWQADTQQRLDSLMATLGTPDGDGYDMGVLLVRLATDHGRAPWNGLTSRQTALGWLVSARLATQFLCEAVASDGDLAAREAVKLILERSGYRHGPALAILARNPPPSSLPTLKQQWEHLDDPDRITPTSTLVLDGLDRLGPDGHAFLRHLMEESPAIVHCAAAAERAGARGDVSASQLLEWAEELVSLGLEHPGLGRTDRTRLLNLRQAMATFVKTAYLLDAPETSAKVTTWLARSIAEPVRDAILVETARHAGHPRPEQLIR